jgi:hypothetical protein
LAATRTVDLSIATRYPMLPSGWPGCGSGPGWWMPRVGRSGSPTTACWRTSGVVGWATGYRPDYACIHIPAVVRQGQVVHWRGVTEVPGLDFLGLSWQHTRGSALLGFVNDDAAYLADRIATSLGTAGSATVPATQQPSR